MSALLSLERISVDLAGRRVVEEVSLSLAPGEIVALLGPNGAGKTTLLRAALGLGALSAGAAKLGEAPAHTLTPRARALRAAYLPQRPQAVWPISIESLVALGRFAYGASPDRLAPRDQAAVDAALKACALEELRARRMDEISGGEKARAHLARALAQQAPVLLLDEPTAGLDPAQALGLHDILRSHAANGHGAIFTTHDVTLAARAADRVVVLREGRVIGEGPPHAALTPQTLEAAYGRRAEIERLGGEIVAVFH